jgi:hypothetical protein
MRKWFLLGFTLLATVAFAQDEFDAEAEDEAEEDDELVFDEIDDAEESIQDSGMMGTSEGTYADSEDVYVLDDETAITNEVDITPSWCD